MPGAWVAWALVGAGTAAAAEPALDGCGQQSVAGGQFYLVCADVQVFGLLLDTVTPSVQVGPSASEPMRAAGVELQAGPPEPLPIDGAPTPVETFHGRTASRPPQRVTAYRWSDPHQGFVACTATADDTEALRARCGAAITAALRSAPRTSLDTVGRSSALTLGDRDVAVEGCRSTAEHGLACPDGSTLDLHPLDLAVDASVDQALDRLARDGRVSADGWAEQTALACRVVGVEGRCLRLVADGRTQLDAVARLPEGPRLVRCAAPEVVELPTACRSAVEVTP